MSKSGSIIKLDGPEGAAKFEELLKNNNCVIRFHMYGCFFCNKMEDEWKKLASRVNESDALVLDVDSEAVGSISHPMKSSINGYPTIIYSPKGQSQQYTKFEDESARTAENMKQWLETLSKMSKTKSQGKKVTKKHKSKSLKSLSSKLGGGSRRKNRSRKTRSRKHSRKQRHSRRL